MNKERRALLTEASELVEKAKALLEQARDEEEEFFDNMPEGFQNGEKGDRAQEVIGFLDDAVNDTETVLDNINSAAE